MPMALSHTGARPDEVNLAFSAIKTADHDPAYKPQAGLRVRGKTAPLTNN